MVRPFFRAAFMLPPSFMLCACGLTVPDIKEPLDKDLPPLAKGDPYLTGTAVLEFEIKKKVFCELRDAVAAARQVGYRSGQYGKEVPKKDQFLPSNWIAQQTLSLEVDESSALNPGVALNNSLPSSLTGFGGSAPASTIAQSFSLGLGGTLSSTSTRIDKFDSYYTVEYLGRKVSDQSFCHPENDSILQKYGPVTSSPLVLQSELGLAKWLLGSLITNRAIPSVGEASEAQGTPSGFVPDTLSIEIKFIVVSNGNITPTWKLVRVSANTGTTPFFGVGRTRTHDLIVTIGPPKAETNFTHLASQIGNAVSNGNRATVSPRIGDSLSTTLVPN